MGTLVVGVLVLAAVALAIRSMHNDKKQGKGCGGDCSHCGGACHYIHTEKQ
ncbi:FeoB-associated Cys-rich membrane protein [Roseburia hominis]